MQKSKSIFNFAQHTPFSIVTCYTLPFAQIFEKTNLTAVLVGDSLGEVLYGFSNTTYVTLEMMKLHVGAVRQGFSRHVIVDLPAGTYEQVQTALDSTKELMSVGADSIKLENPKTAVVEALIAEGIVVWGHIGLTPQTMTTYRKVGKTAAEKSQLLIDAQRLQNAGCQGLFLEAIPSELAKEITALLTIPTIGIAAGKSCRGQVMVHYDVLGMTGEKKKYFFHYENLTTEITRIVEDYIKKVEQKS